MKRLRKNLSGYREQKNYLTSQILQSTGIRGNKRNKRAEHPETPEYKGDGTNSASQTLQLRGTWHTGDNQGDSTHPMHPDFVTRSEQLAWNIRSHSILEFSLFFLLWIEKSNRAGDTKRCNIEEL